MASIDQLCKQLGIRHPLDQPTCIGYGLKKPTCGLLAAQPSRQTAVSVLNSILYTLNRGEHVRTADLDYVARLLLCKTWHQYQAADKVSAWEHQLNGWRTSSSIPTSWGIPQPYAYSLPVYQDCRYGLENHSSMVLFEELERRLGRAPQHSVGNTIFATLVPLGNNAQSRSGLNLLLGARPNNNLGTAAARIEAVASDNGHSDDEVVRGRRRIQETLSGSQHTSSSTSTQDVVERRESSHSSGTSRVGTSQRGSQQPSSSRTERSLGQTLNGSVPGTGSSTLPQERPSLESVRRSRIAALTPAPSVATSSTITTPVLSPSPSSSASDTTISQSRSRSPSPLRHSHQECGICLMPYGEEAGEAYWQCEECLNRCHDQCFQGWANSTPDGGLRCVYCRTNVESVR